jgi:hypothetical protein
MGGGTSFLLFRPMVFKLLKGAIFQTEKKCCGLPSLPPSLCQTYSFSFEKEVIVSLNILIKNITATLFVPNFLRIAK